jgi:hypothetical protein
MMRRRLIVAFILALVLGLVVCARLPQRSRSATGLSVSVLAYTNQPISYRDVVLVNKYGRPGFVSRSTNSAEYDAFLFVTNESGVGFEGTFTTEILCGGKWIPAAFQSDIRLYGIGLPASSYYTILVPLPNEPVEWRVKWSLQRSLTRSEAWVANVMPKVGLRYPRRKQHILVSPVFRSEGSAQPVASGNDAPPVSLREAQE